VRVACLRAGRLPSSWPAGPCLLHPWVCLPQHRAGCHGLLHADQSGGVQHLRRAPPGAHPPPRGPHHRPRDRGLAAPSSQQQHLQQQWSHDHQHHLMNVHPAACKHLLSEGPHVVVVVTIGFLVSTFNTPPKRVATAGLVVAVVRYRCLVPDGWCLVGAGWCLIGVTAASMTQIAIHLSSRGRALVPAGSRLPPPPSVVATTRLRPPVGAPGSA